MANIVQIEVRGTDRGARTSLLAAGGAVRRFAADADGSKGPIEGVTDRLLRMSGVLRALKTIAIASALTAAIPGALGLAAALAQAAGSAALLPAVVIGGAIAIGALKIATSGFGAALKEVGDPKKFAEALKSLTPAARGAAVAVQGLKGPYDDLKRSLQERLFEGLAGQITRVGAALMGRVRPAFESVASTANRTLRQVAMELGSTRRQMDFQNIGSRSASAFSNLAFAVRPLVAAMLDAAAVGATFLPALTAGAGSAAQRFADLVREARETGRLGEIIQAGLDALRQLGEVAGNVGSAIGGMLNAANVSGGGFLNTLVAITARLAEIINSAAGQAVLAAAFGTIALVVRTVVDTLGAVMPVLAPVLLALNHLATVVMPLLGPAVAAVVASLAPMVTLFLQLATVILPPLLAALQFLAPAIGPLAAYILAVVGATKVWAAAQWLLNAALTANPIGLVIVAIGALIAIIAVCIAHWGAIRGAVISAMNAIGGAVGSTVGAAVGAMARFGGAIRSGITSAVASVRGMGGQLLSAVGNFGSLLYAAGRNVVQGLINGIKSMIGALGSAIGSVASKIRNALPFSPAKEGPLRDNPPDRAGRTIVEMLATGMRSALPRLEAIVNQTVAPVINGLSAPSPARRAAGPAPGVAAQARELTLTFKGNTDGAFAAAFMHLVRTGKIQISA